MEEPRVCSSTRKSDLVFLRSTSPLLTVTPETLSRLSVSEVFPLPKCPKRAMFRRFFVLYSFINTSLYCMRLHCTFIISYIHYLAIIIDIKNYVKIVIGYICSVINIEQK